jgi:uncharacterized membrane protein YbhN (UPF0104 family)
MTKGLFIKVLSFLRKIYLPLAILFITYIATINFPEITEVISHVNIIDISTYVQVLLLIFCSYSFRTLRWLLYIKKIETASSRLHHSIIYLSGFAFTASPGKSGELMRATHLSRLHVKFNYTLACFLSERFLDVIIVLSLSAYAIVIITDNSIFLFLPLILLALLFSLNPLLSMQWISQYTKKVELITDSLPLWKVNVTFRSTILTVIAWSAQGVVLYLFLAALGEDISLLTAVSIYCLSLLIGAVSLIPGGLGATELGMSWLLTQAGIPSDMALIAALLTRTLTLWPAMLIGLICSGLLLKQQQKLPTH